MSTTRSSKANGGDRGAPPTDMELMLYVDGELDEARHEQIEGFLLRDPTYRAKVAGLDVVAGMLRDDALSRGAADGIADAVMAKIAAEEADGGAVADLPRAPAKPVAGASDDAVRVQLSKRPANDNARGIFALAAGAVAAAAALMIWGRTEAEPPRAAFNAPVVTEGTTAPPAIVAPASPELEGVEPEPGVEVAAVDFGAGMGTVFYVPQGSAASSPTTTVVWLSDNGPGGNL